MEPLLSSGDRILIDVSLKVPVPRGIFVIWDGMGLVAKRIEHVPHSEPPKVVFKSLNPEYNSYERLGDEIRVVGRAVWGFPGSCSGGMAAPLPAASGAHPGEAARCPPGHLDSERPGELGLLFWLSESLMKREKRP